MSVPKFVPLLSTLDEIKPPVSFVKMGANSLPYLGSIPLVLEFVITTGYRTVPLLIEYVGGDAVVYPSPNLVIAM